MLNVKLPETDEERMDILRTIVQEEQNETLDKILSGTELHELQLFMTSFERARSALDQVLDDRNKAKNLHADLFKNARLYVSHFIQVLFLTAIRNEIKAENLSLYGLNEKDRVLPDLSTEEAVLNWGENLIRGESERTNRGGIPMYNPAIAKVKVHYELFKESIQSMAVYEKNVLRLHNNMEELRKKADESIWRIWTKVEERYCRTSPDEQALRFKAYKMQIYHREKEPLSVFDYIY